MIFGVSLSRYPGLGEVHMWSPAGRNPVFPLMCVSDNSVMHGSLRVVGWMVSLIFVAENCARGSFKTWGMCLGWLLVGSSWVGNHLMKPTEPFTSSSSAIPSMVQANNLGLLGCSGKNGYGMKVDSKSGQATRGIWKREKNMEKNTYFPNQEVCWNLQSAKGFLHYCKPRQTPIPVYLSISPCRKWWIFNCLFWLEKWIRPWLKWALKWTDHHVTGIMGRACPQIISQGISGYDHI